MKRLLIGLISFVATISLLVGCSKGESTDGGNKSGFKIGLSVNTLNNPFFVNVKEGAEARAKELGIEIVVTDAQNSPAQQVTDVENLLQQKLDLIIIDPADSDSIAVAVEKANEAGIPVITIDRKSNGGKVETHIGFDAIKSGSMAAEYLAEVLGGKGKIVEIQGILGTNVAQDRSKGFNDTIAKYPDMEIIAQQSADFDRGKAMSVMEDILQANPKIDGIYAANDEMLLGALAAIEAAGRLDEIVIIGCDGLDDTLAAIKDGRVEATIGEFAYKLGQEGVNAAKKILDGEKVEPNVILESVLITNENVDDFIKQK